MTIWFFLYSHLTSCNILFTTKSHWLLGSGYMVSHRNTMEWQSGIRVCWFENVMVTHKAPLVKWLFYFPPIQTHAWQNFNRDCSGYTILLLKVDHRIATWSSYRVLLKNEESDQMLNRFPTLVSYAMNDKSNSSFINIECIYIFHGSSILWLYWQWLHFVSLPRHNSVLYVSLYIPFFFLSFVFLLLFFCCSPHHISYTRSHINAYVRAEITNGRYGWVTGVDSIQ